MLNKYANVPLDSEPAIKDCEHEFEKFYFISMVSERVRNLIVNHSMTSFILLSIGCILNGINLCFIQFAEIFGERT